MCLDFTLFRWALFCSAIFTISLSRLTVWYRQALWPDTTLMKALDLSNQGLLYLSSCSPLSFPFWKKRRNTHLKSMWIIILNSSILPDLFSYDHNNFFYFNPLWMYCSSVTCKTKHHKNKRKSLPVVAQHYKPIAHCRFWNTSNVFGTTWLMELLTGHYWRSCPHHHSQD